MSVSGLPRAIAADRHGVSGADRAIAFERLKNRLDKAVLRIADQPFAVRPEIRQFALMVPDRDRRAGGDPFGTRQTAKGFDRTQGGRQLSVGARLLDRIEVHAIGARELIHELGQVFLIADIAGAGRVPEMHDPDTSRSGQRWRQAQNITGKQRRLITERTDVSALKPFIARP